MCGDTDIGSRSSASSFIISVCQSAMLTGFPYQPLDDSQSEIRLITILPEDLNDEIKCSIHHASLMTCPSYHALSYVWGDGSSGHHQKTTLQLDGVEISATKNLLDALRQLRHSIAGGGEQLCVWIDALCINQADVAERSQQVSMMRDIYSSAERVIIWLGEADDGSDEAFDALSSIVNDDATSNAHPAASEDKATKAAVEDASRGDENRSAVMRRCSSFLITIAERRPWFRRTWILQELAMARQDPLVLCGSKSAPWSTLMRAWDAVAMDFFAEIGVLPLGLDEEVKDGSISLSDAANGFRRPMVKMDVLNELRVTVRKKGGISLRQLLMVSRSSLSTDPRDRIYGLLGMVGTEEVTNAESEVKPIVVDYEKSVAEVYTDAMAYLFSRGEGPHFLSGVFLPGLSLDPLHLAPEKKSQGKRQEMSKEPQWPSWAPDFSRQDSQLALQPSGIIFHPPANLGGASGVGANAHNGSVIRDDNNHPILTVEALLVDTIRQVMQFGPTLRDCISGIPDFEDIVKQAEREATQNKMPSAIWDFISRQRTSQPLWKILISNKAWNSGYQPAPEEYGNQYRRLLEQGEPKSTSHSAHIEQTQTSEFERCLTSCAGKKSLFTTDSGLVGTGVPGTVAGDIVAVVFGSPTPFVLRPLASRVVSGEERQIYGLVGASYVGGIMSGEMVDELYCEDLMDSTTLYIQ